jgi:hypothetical protein
VLEVTHAALWIVLGLQGLFICFLVKELAEIRQITQGGTQVQDGLPLGSKAPHFAASDLRSGRAVDSSTFVGTRVAMLLLTPDCGECRRLSGQLHGAAPSLAGQFIVFCHGATRRCQHLLSKLPASVAVLVDEHIDLADAYKVRGFPALIVLDEQWQIAGHGYPYQIADIERILSAAQRAQNASEDAAAVVPLAALEERCGAASVSR